jgi:hypothetical protein
MNPLDKALQVYCLIVVVQNIRHNFNCHYTLPFDDPLFLPIYSDRIGS